MNVTVNMDRLRRDLETLGGIGRMESGGISRTSFSAEDRQARQWYQTRCADAGLTVRTDGLGNMFTASESPCPDGTSSVWTGSHIDTVPDGGPLDGALGAIAALECARRISEERIALSRPVTAVVFADEEGSYAHLLGSTGIARGYSQDELEAMTGRDGDRLVDALARSGWNPQAATSTRVDPGKIHAFIELHIEQGPCLEATRTDIGVVTSIVGVGGGRLDFHGRADHAGTTPMMGRRDALRAAGAFLTTLPDLAASVGPAGVATCGSIRVEPGAANVVPRLATLTIDFRDPDPVRFAALEKAIVASAAAIAATHDVSVVWHPKAAIDPAPLDVGVQAVISGAAAAWGLSATHMPSGAGHDAQIMARLAPTGMIFVPSAGGRSHSPAEHTSWQDIENGANVLLAAVLTLASS